MRISFVSILWIKNKIPNGLKFHFKTLNRCTDGCPIQQMEKNGRINVDEPLNYFRDKNEVKIKRKKIAIRNPEPFKLWILVHKLGGRLIRSRIAIPNENRL